MSALPENLLAEAGLLGIILNHNGALHELPDNLGKADFSDDGHGELFILFKDLIGMGRLVTALTVLHDAQDAVIWEERGMKASQYLAKLEAEAPLSDYVEKAKSFATTILSTALMRRTIVALDGLRERIVNAPSSIPAAVLRDDVDSTMTSLFTSAIELGLEDVADIGDRILNRLKNTDREVGRTLGLKFIQDLTGPALPGRLMIIAGSSGAGKSALAAQIARWDAQQGGAPALFTREMPREEVTARFLAGDAEVRAEQIERNFLDPAEFEGIYNANEAMRGLKLKIGSPSKFSVPYIRAVAHRTKKLSGLSMVLIDHVHLLGKSDRRMSENEAFNENLEGLKAMSMDLDVPVIGLAQLGTEGLKDLNKWPHRLPMFTDLLYSAAVDRNADVVLLIHRLEHVLRKNQPQREVEPDKHRDWEARLMQVGGQVEAILTKRRGGEGEGRRTGYFERGRTRFADRTIRPPSYGSADQPDLMTTM